MSEGPKDRRESGRTPEHGAGPGNGEGGNDRGGRAGGHRNGPDGPLNDLTGNGIVNNRPEHESGTGRYHGGDHGGDNGAPVTGGNGGGRAGGPLGRPDGEAGLGERLRGDLGSDLSGDLSSDRATGPGSGTRTGSGSDPSAGPDPGPGSDLSLGGDELALRRMLHSAVEDLEPTDGVLDHLRKAVPNRRARKRQAMVGMAAAALLFGTAIPAFIHVASAGSTSDRHAVSASHGEPKQGAATAADNDSKAAGDDTGRPSGQATTGKDDPGRTKTTEVPVPGTPGAGSAGASGPGGTQDKSSPTCDANQLGVTEAEAGAPSADGTVYGTFKITNVSGAKCSVSGAGSIGFKTGGVADAHKITVVEHTAGDLARGLPDPSKEASALQLAPTTAYEVKFAFVPSDTCPPATPSPDPSPTSGGTPDASGSASGSGGSGSAPGLDPVASDTGTQLGGEDGGTQNGSVSVSHTAEPGGPSAQTTIPNACAGTIYRTGVLDAS
jgi:hypothetical protein